MMWCSDRARMSAVFAKLGLSLDYGSSWLLQKRIGLHRVGLSVFSFNERAIRSYEKAGFRIEGRLREAISRDGRYWDEIQMGILRDDWLAIRSGTATTAGTTKTTAYAKSKSVTI